MPGLRQRFKRTRRPEEDQNFVPGFRATGREDLRDADRMLRSQIAQELGKVLGVEILVLVAGMEFRELELMGESLPS